MRGALLEAVEVLRGVVGDDLSDSIVNKGRVECNTTG